MLWKKTWQPEIALLLVGAVVLAFFMGSAAVELLVHFGAPGFRTPDSVGSVLLATLSFHGMAIIAGVLFLKLHDISWREALGWRSDNWKNLLLLTVLVLAAVLPVMFGLKYVSELVLNKMGWEVEDQRAVEMFSGITSTWMKVYFGFFTVVLAPVAEEFFFRGLLFSAAKKYGRPGLGWIGVSLLFAFIHFSAPIFLPLFVLALALTWLYEKTEGLLAPMLAHSLFNAVNLGLLFLTEHAGHPPS